MTKKYKLSVLGNTFVAAVIAITVLLLHWAVPTTPAFIGILMAINFAVGILLVMVLVIFIFMDFNSGCKLFENYYSRIHWLWTGLLCGFPIIVVTLLGLAWVGSNWQEYLIEEVEES